MKLLFSLFLFSSLCYAQNNNWDKLKKSAHSIGFCIYNINEPHCNKHEATLKKYEENAKEDEDVYYFLLKEDWAKKRLTEWAEQQQGNLKTHILLFDINQGFKYRNELNSPKANSRFYILDLKDELTLKIGYKRYSLTISHNNEPNILENSLWREFMSGRLGLLKKKIEFNAFSKSKPKKRLKVFKKRFLSYRTSLLKK
jgi:hypothetical protein